MLGARLSILMLAAFAASCTTETVYTVGQQWRKQECLKLPDRDERARCERSTATSYEQYRSEAEAARKPPQ